MADSRADSGLLPRDLSSPPLDMSTMSIPLLTSFFVFWLEALSVMCFALSTAGADGLAGVDALATIWSAVYAGVPGVAFVGVDVPHPRGG